MHKSKLYIIPTPIGNIKDITLRALDTLSDVDIIFCEDTRICSKLLKHYNIKTPTYSLNERNQKNKIKNLLDKLHQGLSVAYMTDAGTPGISDPGNFIVASVAENDFDIEILPGPSALTAALSGSGIDVSRFVFMGFIPNKTKRLKFLKQVISFEYPVAFFESTHRIKKLMEELNQLSPTIKITLAKELTKTHEEFIRNKTPKEILSIFSNDPKKQKGEFVVILHK